VASLYLCSWQCRQGPTFSKRNKGNMAKNAGRSHSVKTPFSN
jgi:hypothetical protein